MKVFIIALRILAYLIGLTYCSILMYQYVAGTWGLGRILFPPLILISFLLVVNLPTIDGLSWPKRVLRHAFIFSISLTIIFSAICIHNKMHNSSSTILAYDFYWDMGLTLYFREDLTYKAINDDFFSTNSYGRYKKYKDTIIMIDKVRLGNVFLKDTMIIVEDGLEFRLEEQFKDLKDRYMVMDLSH